MAPDPGLCCPSGVLMTGQTLSRGAPGLRGMGGETGSAAEGGLCGSAEAGESGPSFLWHQQTYLDPGEPQSRAERPAGKQDGVAQGQARVGPGAEAARGR